MPASLLWLTSLPPGVVRARLCTQSWNNLKAELGSGIRIIKIDVDKNAELSNAYRIQSVPTLMLFRSGQVLWRQSGAMRLADLKNIIKEHSARFMG